MQRDFSALRKTHEDLVETATGVIDEPKTILRDAVSEKVQNFIRRGTIDGTVDNDAERIVDMIVAEVIKERE